MTAIDDHELAAYVVGDAPDDLRSRMEAAAAADPKLAAALGALAPLGGPGDVRDVAQETRSPDAPAQRHWFRLRRVGMAAGILLAVCGAAWAGYELLRAPPLLEDDFRTRTVAHHKWDPHLGRPGVTASDGYLRLLNRGSVVTRAEFDGPIEISLDWRWVDLAEWPLYGERFVVCLRTSGRHEEAHPFEVSDGLRIEFSAVDGAIRAIPGGWPPRPDLAATPADAAPFPSGEWHRLRIVDDGKVVSVFVEGPSVDRRYRTEPILTVAVPAGLAGRRVALFNREYLARRNHESHVDNVTIRSLAR